MFELKTPLPPRLVLSRFRERLLSKPGAMSGVVADGRVDLFVPPHFQHHGSRQLSLKVEAHSTAGSILHCRFCSHPHDWALRVGLVAAGAVGLMISVCLASAQYLLGQPPSALLLLVPLGLLSVGVWVFEKRNHRRGLPQVEELQRFLEQEITAIEYQAQAQCERA